MYSSSVKFGQSSIQLMVGNGHAVEFLEYFLPNSLSEEQGLGQFPATYWLLLQLISLDPGFIDFA